VPGGGPLLSFQPLLVRAHVCATIVVFAMVTLVCCVWVAPPELVTGIGFTDWVLNTVGLYFVRIFAIARVRAQPHVCAHMPSRNALCGVCVSPTCVAQHFMGAQILYHSIVDSAPLLLIPVRTGVATMVGACVR